MSDRDYLAPGTRAWVISLPGNTTLATGMTKHRLAEYQAKHDFAKTAEQSGKAKISKAQVPDS